MIAHSAGEQIWEMIESLETTNSRNVCKQQILVPAATSGGEEEEEEEEEEEGE